MRRWQAPIARAVDRAGHVAVPAIRRPRRPLGLAVPCASFARERTSPLRGPARPLGRATLVLRELFPPQPLLSVGDLVRDGRRVLKYVGRPLVHHRQLLG